MSETKLCKSCQAPLDYREGDAIAICSFCNEVNVFREEKETGEHFLLGLTIDQSNMRSYLIGDLLKIPGVPDAIQQTLQIKEAKLIYLPYYVTQVHGNLKWAGLGRQATYSNRYKGAYKRIHFHTEPENGVFDDQVTVITFAGEHSNPIFRDYKFAAKGRQFFATAEIDKNNGDLAEPLFDFIEAEKRAVQQLEMKHQRLLQEELDRVDFLEPNYVIPQNQLFHVPFWLITWKTRTGAKDQHTIIDASSGITLETDTPRSASYVLMTFSIAFAFLFFAIFPYLVYPFTTNTNKMLIILTFIFSGALSIQTFYKNWPRKFKESKA